MKEKGKGNQSVSPCTSSEPFSRHLKPRIWVLTNVGREGVLTMLDGSGRWAGRGAIWLGMFL